MSNSESGSMIRDTRNSRQRQRIELIRSQMIADSMFYDSPQQYQANLSDFHEKVNNVLPSGWRLFRRGIWLQATPPIAKVPIHGWKIHVSSILATANEVLDRAVRIAVDHNVVIKFLADKSLLRTVNAQDWPRSAAGKFITIYPSSQEQCAMLLELLGQKLEKFAGPYILTDRRYMGPVFYRYGGLSPIYRMRYDGLVENLIVDPIGNFVYDLRLPKFTLPSWVKEDPFSSTSSNNHLPSELTLKNGRFLVRGAIHFSSSGGVYIAKDNETGQEVIIKEARPHIGDDPYGNDAISNRKREWNILNLLKDTGLTPNPIDLFYQWEHLFLVREYIKGKALSQFPLPLEPAGLANDIYARQLDRLVMTINIFESIRKAIRTVHEHGIVLGDISASNILILDSYSPVFIDLESAYQPSHEETSPLITMGFGDRFRQSRERPTQEDDEYTLSCLAGWMIFPITPLLEVEPRSVTRFLAEIECDYRLPFSLSEKMNIVSDSLSRGTPRSRHDSHVNSTETVAEGRSPDFRQAQAHEIDEMTEGLLRAIEASATYDRSDRLFPCDPSVAHPLEVAHGCLGILYALHKIKGQVNGKLKSWMEQHLFSLDSALPGLYHGLSGIAWVLNEIGYPDWGERALAMATSHPELYNGVDIEYGLAGYGLTCLYFWSTTKREIYLRRAYEVATYLMNTVRHNALGAHWNTVSGEKFVGYARGNAGIALFFLYISKVSGESRFQTFGMLCLNDDLQHGQKQAGGYLSFPEEPGAAIVSPYWRFGTSGIATTLLRYVYVTNDVRLNSILSSMIPDVLRKYTVFPGLFSGIAGLGNLALDCSEYLDQEEHAEHARSVARTLTLFGVRSKDGGILMPGDFLYRCSMDYGTGSAGVALLLWRIRHRLPNFNFTVDALLTQ